jgi:dihydrofolate reductase
MMTQQGPTSSQSQRQIVSMIAAMSENRVIGREGKLPWRLPADLKYFKRVTSGHTIIMGRKTWESIGCKPLPNRRNIVITRQHGYAAAGAEVASSVDEALALSATDGEVFIVGGGEVYVAALPRADRLYLTLVHTHVDGDAMFPPIDLTQWRERGREDRSADGENPYPISFILYERG